MNDEIMSEMNKAVAFETGSINANASLEINKQQPLVIARDSNKTINIDNTQNFYEKVQSPYETAKQTKNTMRRLAYGY